MPQVSDSRPQQPRIALAIHALNGGGAERLMSQLAERWCVNNEVHLITWSSVHSDAYQVPKDVMRHGLDLQMPSRGLGSGIVANLRRVRVLRATLKKIQPRMLLSFSDQMNIVALEAARRLPFPTWIAEHSDPARQRLGRLWEGWRSRSYPRAAGCVALTPSIARTLEDWIPASRLRVIPPAIDPPAIASPASIEDGRSAEKAARVLFVGRLSPEKGIDLLLRAWQQIAADLPGWELHIAGDGNERLHLEQMAMNTRGVCFLGWLETPWSAFQTADLFVLPSRYEGFPIALLEAMSQGKACIVSRCTSAIDILNASGEALRVVPVESAEHLAKAIHDLARAPETRRLLGEHARRVSEEYRWQQVGQLWDQLLDDALSHSVANVSR
jgi:GalNAc-alpha-(1->4)-GalNAc-alpha-(1->3)-diNAcBac-PP-undecaprenol alpha-1,4-N-acetyl-D-galactosaminyltransferase